MRHEKPAARVLLAWLGAMAACAAPEVRSSAVRPPSAPSAAPSSTASGAVAVTPDAGNAPDAGAPPATRARVGLERREEDGVGRIYVVSRELDLRELVAEEKPPFVCAVQLAAKRRHEREPTARIELGCDPTADPVVVARVTQDKHLVVTPLGAPPRDRPLDGEVDLDATLAPPEPNPATCKSKPLAVVVDKVDAPFQLRVRVPDLKLVVPWGWPGHSKIGCSSQIYRAAKRIEARCSSAETQTSINVFEERGVLWFVTRSDSYEGGSSASRGGVALPCGATPSFSRFAYRHPQWSPLGFGMCGCSDAQSACLSPCYENDSDERGELTDKGTACLVRCMTSYEACVARCPPTKW